MAFNIVGSNIDQFEINGRHYKIEYRAGIQNPLRNDLESIIRVFCETEIAEKLPRITFVIERNKVNDAALAWIDTKEAKGGLKVIHLDAPSLQESHAKESNTSFTRYIVKALAHEASHLIREMISREITIKDLTQKRLSEHLAKSKKVDDHSQFSVILEVTRWWLHRFINDLHTEGFAEFNTGQIATRFDYNETYQDSLYRISKRKLLEIEALRTSLFSKFEEIQNPEKYKGRESDYFADLESLGKLVTNFTLKIRHNSYGIGEYMYYLINYHSKKEIDFVKIKVFKFIKKYEEIEISKNRKPIISLNSKQGYFDYYL